MTNPTPHCEGPPTVTGWRVGSNGTAFAVKVCACGQTMEYIEVEVMNCKIELSQDGYGNAIWVCIKCGLVYAQLPDFADPSRSRCEK